MLRLAGVPASTKAEYSGDVRLTADQLVTQYLTGKADRDHFTFCGFHTGSSRPDFLTVNFSLTQQSPPVDTADSEFKAYRMGRVARVSNRAGFLYFDCSSTKFEGSTQLVRAEVDPLYRVTEPLATAREDYLRALHGSSRVLSRLLGCKPGTGITGSFTVPPAA
ncbi:hypothetical protein ACIGXF_12135 [Streptomyces sp. NPDC053086]|uniref:hypothetical protein n=1 Tax=unclassified Streptomyces TaxID=2593676 RepID=UPI0037CD6504